jgi:hypothetical protein
MWHSEGKSKETTASVSGHDEHLASVKISVTQTTELVATCDMKICNFSISQEFKP